jgi:hypothetical protein
MENDKNLMDMNSIEEQERRMFTAFAIAADAKAKAKSLSAKAAKAQAEAEWFFDWAIRIGEALRGGRDAPPYTVHSHKLDRTRKLLLKALGMLGSERVGERASAALKAEKFRKRLGRTWDQLIAEEFDDDEDLDDEDNEDLDDEDNEDLDEEEEGPIA